MPGHSHTYSWTGVPFSFCLLLFGAYRVARAGARPGRCFIFGCGSAFLFVPRWFGMDRFSLWVQSQPLSPEVLTLLWMAFSLFLGAVCACVATIVHPDDDEDVSGDATEDESE